jgi:hypothetical protein
MNLETKVLLKKAASEIEALRRDNEVMAAKVQVMDLFGAALFAIPYDPPQGMAEDIVWRIRCALEEEESDDD